MPIRSASAAAAVWANSATSAADSRRRRTRMARLLRVERSANAMRTASRWRRGDGSPRRGRGSAFLQQHAFGHRVIADEQWLAAETRDRPFTTDRPEEGRVGKGGG